MSKYLKVLCNYCGSRVRKEAVVNGIYYNNSCENQDCREHGNEDYEDELCDSLSAYDSYQALIGYDDDY